MTNKHRLQVNTFWRNKKTTNRGNQKNSVYLSYDISSADFRWVHLIFSRQSTITIYSSRISNNDNKSVVSLCDYTQKSSKQI